MTQLWEDQGLRGVFTRPLPEELRHWLRILTEEPYRFARSQGLLFQDPQAGSQEDVLARGLLEDLEHSRDVAGALEARAGGQHLKFRRLAVLLEDAVGFLRASLPEELP